MSAEPAELVPAATVVLVRDGHDGLETLMLHRNSKIAFGGMWVFPGGRVDDDDVDPADVDDEQAAARRAAVREAAEEAGLVVDEAALVPFSHWVPPIGWPRRFATWFFLAPAPAGTVVIDGGEIHDHAWLPPGEALARRDRGEIELAPPTWVTLWQLSEADTVAGALDLVRTRDLERFETRMAKLDDGLVALWHGDAGYADADPSREGPRHRLLMLTDGWRYERTA